MSGTVGLLHYPWGEDLGVAAMAPRTPRRVWRRGLAYRSNPRSPEYMRALLAERLPDAELVRSGEPGWEERVRGADRVVLLYPDSIGVGFGGFERRLAELGAAPETALNGRRRDVALDPSTHRALRLRRFLERTMVVELAGLAAIAIATPFLLLADGLRGRR